MKRVLVLTAVFLSSCSGGQQSSIPSSTVSNTASHVLQQTTTAAAASCSVAQFNAPGQDVRGPVGTTTTDAWAIDAPISDAAPQSTVLAHFVNGTKVASYGTQAPSTATQGSGVGRIEMIDGVPWTINWYVDSHSVQTFAVGRFDGTKLVTYPLPPSLQWLPDIGGSRSTGVFVAATDAKGEVEMFRFNGSSFVHLATAPYANMSIVNMRVFGSNSYVLLTQVGTDEAFVTHYNGSSFAFHALKSGPYGGNGSEITGTSPTDLWATTASGIWHFNGNWQPFAYQQQSTDRYGDYMEGVAEFSPTYVLVPTMYGSNSTQGALVYNGVDRFAPLSFTLPSGDAPINTVSAVPGAKAFYASWTYWYNGYIQAHQAALVSCPSSPPA